MISIIIPVYNTGKKLNKCLKSVVNQTYKDIEIIIVNDHSTDKITNRIIQEWKVKESRIKLINKDVSEGVDRARCSAIKIAQGEFLAFIDSDDWIENNALETLFVFSERTGADVLIGKMRKVYFSGLLTKDAPYEREWMNRLIYRDELMSKYYLSFFGVNIMPINLCAVLYRTSIVKSANIQPSGLKFGEDLLMNLKIFPHINTLYAVNKVVYNYNLGLSCFSDKYLDNWLENARELYIKKMQLIKEMGYNNAEFWQKIELKNYLKFYVYSCCTRRDNNRVENVRLLHNELQNSIYRDLNTLLKTELKDKEPVRFIVKGDALGLYNYVEDSMKHLPFSNKLTIFVSKFLSRCQNLVRFCKTD